MGVTLIRDDAKSVTFDLLSVDAGLVWMAEPSGFPTAVPPTLVGSARSLRTSNVVLNAEYDVGFELDFAIPPMALNLMEEARAGGEPRFSIAVRYAGLARYDLPDNASGVPYLSPFVADELWVVSHDSNSHRLTIDRSRWVEKILPGLGFGNWMVYEVPVENFEGSAQVDVYLHNAVKQFLSGEYKLSIAASRDVVETLERELGGNANPAFGDRFGSADKKMRKVADAYGQLTEAMLGFQSALKSLLAAGAHPERPDEYVERPDAEMALWVALSLRRYVGMRLRTTRPPASESLPEVGNGPG